MRRTFVEFFAGGGMARLGLGDGWDCLWANDHDAAKCAAYRENFGGEDLHEGDVAEVPPSEVPQADLAWASFPCQDLSLAGARRGMGVGAGSRSSVFWAFWFLIARMAREGRAPRVLAIENVVGLASANGSEDFATLTAALASVGYRWDAHVVDAAGFVPQSRPRLFVIAWQGEPPEGMLEEDGAPRSRALEAAFAAAAAMGGAEAKARRALRLPTPPGRNLQLGDIVEDDGAPRWRTAAETKAILRLMAPRHRARLEEARAQAKAGGRRVAGTLYRRMRPAEAGRGNGTVQRAEVRFDIAGCLRTPAGGSSRQTLVICEPDGRVRLRLLSGREAARLMGLPDADRLPKGYTHAYKLAGDGVAVPAARWIAAHLLEPLLDHMDARDALAGESGRAADVALKAAAV